MNVASEARSVPAGALVPRVERLRDIKLVGLGGVGGIVARYLFLYLIALDYSCRVVLIDGDDFESKNDRMFFSRLGNKAAVVRDDLLDMLPDSCVSLVAEEEYVTEANLTRLIRPGDTVLAAVDNHATRQILGDHCDRKLKDFCLISGGNDGVGPDSSGASGGSDESGVDLRGTYGNVQIHVRSGGRDQTPPLARFHPEIAQPGDKPPGADSCIANYASVPQLLFTNLATASAMLNAFQLHLCDALHYPELGFDVFDGLMRPVMLPMPK